MQPRQAKTRIAQAMAGIAQIALLAILVLTIGGCASAKTYFVDRGRDAADIFTATVGRGYGATARVGPLHAGLAMVVDWTGIRNGCLPSETHWAHRDPLGGTIDHFLVPMGFYGRHLGPSISFGSEAFPDRGLIGSPTRAIVTAESPFPFFSIPYPSSRDVPVSAQTTAKYLTQVEVAGGLWFGARLGFSPGELVDFILGWTTLDIFDDDTASRKRSAEWAQKLKEPDSNPVGVGEQIPDSVQR